MVQDLVDGTFLLNCPWTAEELENSFLDRLKHIANQHQILYTIDGIKIGKEIGLGGRINTILQAAFFKMADIIIPKMSKVMKKAAKDIRKKG